MEPLFLYFSMQLIYKLPLPDLKIGVGVVSFSPDHSVTPPTSVLELVKLCVLTQNCREEMNSREEKCCVWRRWQCGKRWRSKKGGEAGNKDGKKERRRNLWNKASTELQTTVHNWEELVPSDRNLLHLPGCKPQLLWNPSGVCCFHQPSCRGWRAQWELRCVLYLLLHTMNSTDTPEDIQLLGGFSIPLKLSNAAQLLFVRHL